MFYLNSQHRWYKALEYYFQVLLFFKEVRSVYVTFVQALEKKKKFSDKGKL